MGNTEKKKMSKYTIMYVKDPSIPKGSDANHGNQMMKEFDGFFSLVWFVLSDKVVQVALKADRFQLITVRPMQPSTRT